MIKMTWIKIFVAVHLLSIAQSFECIHRLDRFTHPDVDWWIVYKLPKMELALTFNSRSVNITWQRFNVKEKIHNPLENTMRQYYDAMARDRNRVTAIAYSDHPPNFNGPKQNIQSTSKGVIMWNNYINAALIVHSIPHFPNMELQQYKFPDEELGWAAAALCLTIPVHETSKWARQLQYEQPFIYFATNPTQDKYFNSYEVRALLSQKPITFLPLEMSEVIRTANGLSLLMMGKHSDIDASIFSSYIRRRTRKSFRVWGTSGSLDKHIPTSSTGVYKIEKVNGPIQLYNMQIEHNDDVTVWAVSDCKSPPYYFCIGNADQHPNDPTPGNGLMCVDDIRLCSQFNDIATNANVEKYPHQLYHYCKRAIQEYIVGHAPASAMSILEKILKDLYVDPVLLAELDEEQKQLLFCKMREEQVRRWILHEKELEATENGSPQKTRSPCRVRWLLDDRGEPWVWVMGDDVDGNRSVDEAIRRRISLAAASDCNQSSADTVSKDPSTVAGQIQVNGNGSTLAAKENALEKTTALPEDWHLEFASFAAEATSPPKGVPKIPVSEEELQDVEREIRLMARQAREQHWLQTLSAESRLRTSCKSRLKQQQQENSVPHLITQQCSDQTLHLSRVAIINWYKTEEFPRRAGVDRNGRCFCAWFHGLISRAEADQLLSSRPVGAFLVRVSEKIYGYVLSYQAGYKVKHFMVLSVPEGYHFVGSTQLVHASLNELVDHHRFTPITDAGVEVLREPVGQSKLPPDYSELLDLFR
uniref:SH2 domain-containing protein n=1 Tax=Trichuris muris TaxID=70415 RepID=A0A5S6QYG4_TRIMR